MTEIHIRIFHCQWKNADPFLPAHGLVLDTNKLLVRQGRHRPSVFSKRTGYIRACATLITSHEHKYVSAIDQNCIALKTGGLINQGSVYIIYIQYVFMLHVFMYTKSCYLLKKIYYFSLERFPLFFISYLYDNP